jgi:8-oxo-dGTP pyrophosphatase MutT (NUDIX family)
MAARREETEARAMIIYRQAVRAILLTPAREILMMQIREPGGGARFWITPGGGMEDGENFDTTLRRELKEELGLEAFDIGPLLWRRQHTFNWGEKRYCQREEYRAVHVPRFAPVMSDATEAAVLQEFRWWPLAEMAASVERFTPLALAEIAGRYLADGAPDPIPDMEVLVD